MLQILNESNLELLDRTFHPGEMCKRSMSEFGAGIITRVDVKALLEHAVSGERLKDGWHTLDEVNPQREADVGESGGRRCVSLHV